MVRFEMSQLNEQLSDLYKKAGIEMDDKARLIADQKFYYMMLRDSKKYSEMADEVSLRELIATSSAGIVRTVTSQLKRLAPVVKKSW